MKRNDKHTTHTDMTRTRRLQRPEDSQVAIRLLGTRLKIYSDTLASAATFLATWGAEWVAWVAWVAWEEEKVALTSRYAHGKWEWYNERERERERSRMNVSKETNLQIGSSRAGVHGGCGGS